MTVVNRQASQLIPATQTQWASENELKHVLAGEVSLLQGPGDRPGLRSETQDHRLREPNPRAAATRDKFRKALLERVTGAKVGGGAGRVEASVITVARLSAVVLELLSDLVGELQALRPDEVAAVRPLKQLLKPYRRKLASFRQLRALEDV